MSSAADAAAESQLQLPTRRLFDRLATLRRGFVIETDVIAALILRETRTRFGRNHLGYLWALIEPMVVILTFYLVLDLANRRPPTGMGLFGFVATGVLPYTLFTNSITRIADAVSSNKALLYYPQVHPLDLVIARALLEAATFVGVFIIVMGAEALLAQRLDLDSSLYVIGGLAISSALGTALGLVFCALGQVTSLADRVRGPLLRPMFWVSGIFFTADQIPEHHRERLLWNPMLHATELTRAGWFESYDARYVDMGYVLWWIGGTLLVGLLLERLVRRRIDLT